MKSNIPVSLGVFDVECNEYMSYQYMPIKLRHSLAVALEPRVRWAQKLIDNSILDFIKFKDRQDYFDSYVYLTIKSGYQRNGGGFNRPGWHIDSFGNHNEENYIWSSCQPTVFNDGPFYLSCDEDLSLDQMRDQVDESKNYTFPDKSLVRVGQAVHRVGDYIEGHRVFFKLSFSRDKYNLVGNTHNYLLNYKWDMVERKRNRNVPQALDMS